MQVLEALVAAQKIVERWDLASGKWIRFEGGQGYRLLSTVSGRDADSRLDARTLATLSAGRIFNGEAYPGEFQYDPRNGQQLPPPVTDSRDVPLWVPPFGGSPVDLSRPATQTLRGLRMVDSIRLQLSKAKSRTKTDREEFLLPLPPAGHHHFMVIHAGVSVPQLLALDLEHGALRWLRPTDKTWVDLSHETNGRLADCTEALKEHWRCEVVESGQASLMFIPTQQGLAVVSPDLLTMSYSVNYFGQGTACGLPMFWNGRVWLPVRDHRSVVRLCGIHPENLSVETLNVTGLPADSQLAASPVCKDGMAIWMGTAGQLLLKKTVDGGLEAQVVPWAEDFKPVFECGSPYVCNKGKFWQLVLGNTPPRYAYNALGALNESPQIVSGPRGCTGKINYKFSRQLKDAPWLETGYVDDANQQHVVFPLIEFQTKGDSVATVLGVQVEDKDGVMNIMKSSERMHAVLIAESDEAILFYSFHASRPWLGSFFVYDDKLWFYHPDLLQIPGWSLVR